VLQTLRRDLIRMWHDPLPVIMIIAMIMMGGAGASYWSVLIGTVGFTALSLPSFREVIVRAWRLDLWANIVVWSSIIFSAFCFSFASYGLGAVIGRVFGWSWTT